MLLAALTLCVFIVAFVLFSLWSTPKPERIQYGVSFNTVYAQELGLDWLEVYTAILDDLKVRHLRLAAHWPMVQPEEDTWNFSELDTQVRMAEARGAQVVLAVGRRLPRWPECHVPTWAQTLDWQSQQAHILKYLETVVSRYKDSDAISYWQVENEPFLTVYAREQCGDLDVTFLEREIALVRALDPTRPILVTDSGNLGLWRGAYKRGDSFGTSVYVYLWNEATGPITSILPPETYILKRTLMSMLYGKKESMLIELSVEPWLNKPITHAPLDLQLERMNKDKFDGIIAYAERTRFSKQYLWGAEWWYWLKEKHGHDEFWNRARELYREGGE